MTKDKEYIKNNANNIDNTLKIMYNIISSKEIMN